MWWAAAVATAGVVASAGQAETATARYAWSNVVIGGGGYVTGLTFHPHERDLFYARTDVGGAYRWDATREVWVPLQDWIDRANNDLNAVISLALDPRAPDKLYLACGAYFWPAARNAAVLRSPDRGETWEVAELPFKLGGNQDGRGTGERLQVDPGDGEILYLGTNHDGLWRSRDGARTWTRVSSFPEPGVTFVLFDPRGVRAGEATPVIYVGAADPRKPVLYRSRDAGRSWEAVPGQPRGLLVHHAAIDREGVLYFALGNGLGPNGVTDGAVWKFDSEAGRWTEITPVRPDGAKEDTFGYAGLALDPRRVGTVFVSTLDRWEMPDEIFRSDDGGATWTPLIAKAEFDHEKAPYTRAMKPHWISELALDPFHPERLWFVTGYGVWATGDARANPATGEMVRWHFLNRGLEETVPDELISPPAGAHLVSGLGDLGGFRHDDVTVSPAAGMFRPFHGSAPGIAFAELAPAVMVRTHYGPTRGAISRDGGRTWENFASAPAEATKFGPGIATVSADGERLVWLPKGSGPYFSTDGGETWKPSRAAFRSTTEWTTYGAVADRVNARRFWIYDPLSGALYASEDGSESFKERKRRLPLEGGKLRTMPGAEGHLWLPTPEGLLVSTDGGKKFRARRGVDAAHQVGFGAPAPGRSEPAVFLDGTVRGETAFFRSDDGGATWIRLNDANLRLGWLRCLTGDARVHGRVYLGTSGRGIVVGEPVRE